LHIRFLPLYFSFYPMRDAMQDGTQFAFLAAQSVDKFGFSVTPAKAGV
jgi:hypothetical protein